MHSVKPLSLFVTGQIASDSVASFRRIRWHSGIGNISPVDFEGSCILSILYSFWPWKRGEDQLPEYAELDV